MVMAAKKAYLIAVVILLIYTGMFVFSKAAFNHGINTYVFIFYRMAAASLFLLPIAIALQRGQAKGLLISCREIRIIICTYAQEECAVHVRGAPSPALLLRLGREHVQPEPVQRQHEDDNGDRGVGVEQLHARHHLLPGAAAEDGGRQAEDHPRRGQGHRRRALPRRSLGARVLRRAGAEPRQPPPRLRRLRRDNDSEQGDVDQGHVAHGPRQRHMGPLDRRAGKVGTISDRFTGIVQDLVYSSSSIHIIRTTIVELLRTICIYMHYLPANLDYVCSLRSGS